MCFIKKGRVLFVRSVAELVLLRISRSYKIKAAEFFFVNKTQTNKVGTRKLQNIQSYLGWLS